MSTSPENQNEMGDDIPMPEALPEDEGQRAAQAPESDQASETDQVGAVEPTSADESASEPVQPAAEGSAEPGDSGKPHVTGIEPTRAGMKWYVLRVASNKENQVRESLERKVRIENLDDRIGRILVPTSKEKRMKAGQVKILEKKLYPGYVFVEMATEPDGSIADSVWFLVKETMGVGDFIGSDGKPSSMRDHDVEMMLLASVQEDEEATLSGLEYSKGDRVKIKEGSFQNFEGNVEAIDETKGVVTVLLTIFGRATPVDVEYWQLEKL